MIIKYNENITKYPIHTVILSDKGEIRYWYDDNGDIHTAVWCQDECILADNEDKPINDIIKILVKDVAKHAYIQNSSLKDKENIVELKKEMEKARRQRNHYTKVLKEKNKYIKSLEEENKRLLSNWELYTYGSKSF